MKSILQLIQREQEMMLIDNRKYLRMHHRSLSEQLVQWERECVKKEDVQVEPSRKGALTLKMNVNGKQQYIHSKYDPQAEAERLISAVDSLEEYDHILFVGIGLGYQMKEVLKNYPSMKFSIYEPNIEVLYQFLSYQDISDCDPSKLQLIFAGVLEEHLRNSIRVLNQKNNNKTFIYTLPAYQKLYTNQEAIIIQEMKDLLKGKRSNLATNVSFQNRWTINSIKNFPMVLQTPNILHDFNKAIFKGKPAIIVAAGPSLNEEFENLKYIKENGLAYIFSVGSAINALIEHGIYPDAAYTYDPTERNQFVIQKVKEENISVIPLIFGSSVGFETLEGYPGKMIHMITSQDKISTKLLDSTQDIDIVLDAPSIAVITFQILSKLGCSPIILVGQNLGYQNDQLYAAGIKYDFMENKLTEEARKNSIIVKDVYGDDIQTNDVFNQMRQQLEMYIAMSPNLKVFNSTKGGAHIAGTEFVHLNDIITNELNHRQVIDKWYESKNSYNFEYVEKKLEKLTNTVEPCGHIMQKLLGELKNIDKAVEKRQSKKIERIFVKFDKEFKKLQSNSYYNILIEPMVRVQNELLLEEIQSFKYESNVLKKGKMVVNSFGIFLRDCQVNLQFIRPYFEELQERLKHMKTEV